MERILTRLAAFMLINGPAAWFAWVAVGLPLPVSNGETAVLIQACAAVLVVVWTPASAVITGWLTGRWTDGPLAGAPLPLVRLGALAWWVAFGPAELRRALVQADQLYGVLASVGTSVLLLLAADAFWLLVGSLFGATRLLHRPGWDPKRTALSTLGATGVATVGLWLLPASWVALDAALDQTGLGRPGAAPPTLIGVLWVSTCLPTLGLYIGSTALCRQPLTVPLALATAGWLAAGLLAAMMDAGVPALDALFTLGVVGPLLGVVALPGVLALGVLGTGVGRMARGERLFGGSSEAGEEAQTSAT